MESMVISNVQGEVLASLLCVGGIGKKIGCILKNIVKNSVNKSIKFLFIIQKIGKK